jgi:hypothetical protein
VNLRQRKTDHAFQNSQWFSAELIMYLRLDATMCGVTINSRVVVMPLDEAPPIAAEKLAALFFIEVVHSAASDGRTSLVNAILNSPYSLCL